MELTRRRWRRWLALALVVAAAAAAALVRRRGPEVPAATAVRAPLEQRLVASGRVEPSASIELAAPAPGRVVGVVVDEGSRVAAGDLLVELDADAARAELARAEAGLAQAEARWRQLRGVGAVQASEARTRAEADLAGAQRTAERARQLAARGALAPDELEEAERALSVAISRRDEARARERASAERGADSLLALAQLEEARALVESARLRLGERRVLAPRAGVVLAREVEAGETVAAGQVLVRLAADGPATLAFETDERNLGLLAVGQRARASADAYPAVHFDAVIDRLSPAIDAQRGTITVRLSMPAPPAFLRPDLTVSIDVLVGQRASAVVVPAAALLPGAAPAVWVVEDGRARRREVALGLRGGDRLEVTAGLDEGALVLLPGPRALRDGQRVRAAGRGAP